LSKQNYIFTCSLKSLINIPIMKLKILIFMCAFLTGNIALSHAFESDTIKTKGGHTAVITFIKHGSLMLEYEGHFIQVDPVSDYADYSKFPKADVIIVTHEHGDHLDAKAIAALEKTGTVLIINQSSHDTLGKGEVMKNGDKKSPTAYLTLEAVPAYNTTPGREMYHPKHRGNGFIVTLDGTRIYIAGDTEDIPEMKELKDIDVAFLPVNQPYTMTVDQAVRATAMFWPKILYPYHYGDTKIEELAAKLKGSKTEVRIRQMQ
jgi:L-ascorbate metabolism protein UlaG (beta-lactamase superfamily)